MVLIYSGNVSSRLNYTVQLIFRDVLGTQARVTDNTADFEASQLPKFSYGTTPLGNEPFLEGGSLLFTCSLDLPVIETITYRDETCFFPTSGLSMLPFDPLASVFLAVSRMEEYAPGTRDQHGRFRASSSYLHRHNLLEKPMVNIWCEMLAHRLSELFPDFTLPPPNFRIRQTIDVDNAFAYLHKGFYRTLAGAIRDLLTGNFARLKQRIAVIAGSETDPYDTYNYLIKTLTPWKDRVHFFFLLGDYHRYDKGVSHAHPELRSVIRRLARSFPIGIHPSYHSAELPDASMLMEEISRLQNILQSKVVASRQHYLRIALPDTYRKLLAAGIREDYSMGYADAVGFRAGIAAPFNFYDLREELETNLRIFPFAFMDVTLLQYANLPAPQAKVVVETMLQRVKATGGYFSAVWHNESLTGTGKWLGYRDIFEWMNQFDDTSK